MRRVIHRIGKDVGLARQTVNALIDLRDVGAGHDYELASYVGFSELASMPEDDALLRKLRDFRPRLGSNDSDSCFRGNQAFDLPRCDFARADNECGPAIKFKENWQQSHASGPGSTPASGSAMSRETAPTNSPAS